MFNRFTVHRQANVMDCGPASLRMIAKYYGRSYSAEGIRLTAGFGKEGVSLLGISEAGENIGFRTRGVQISFKQLREDALLPCILHWNQNHFVVLPYLPSRWRKRSKITIADPARGLFTLTEEEFLAQWISNKNANGESIGTALLLEPTAKFYEHPDGKETKLSWGLVFQYLKNSKWGLTQVFLALFATSLFQLIFPFLTQSIVDTGINTRNLQFISIVLIAQLMLVFSRTVINFIRSRLLLGISINVNFSLLSDFWIKLTRLPISYFDNYHTGDTLQRLGDTKSVESFLTGSAVNTLFLSFNFVAFSAVLILYNFQLFLIFTLGSISYFLWIRLFLRIRRKINYQTFHLAAKENTVSLQLVQGMQELKLNSAEHLKRWEWENVQASLFKLNLKNLSFSQLQEAGALFINEGKNLVITFMVAQMVVQGQLTLGAMLAVQYIIGQLNSPIEQFVGFIQHAQDAKISLERLNEIHQMKEEENSHSNEAAYLQHLPEHKSIFFSNFSFTYPGVGNDPVLKNVNISIPEGKTTAIVGVSGSGKTTLLKLLLKFYEQYEGDIIIGTKNTENTDGPELKFKYISPSYWRKQCGAVLQDGYIFNDSIARNIAVGYDQPDFSRLVSACKTANILSFIESLPNGFNTKLGTDGKGISQGQKQRLLIARAVYKDPEYLFFDEATNSLDANNEKAIVENLQEFFKGRTVVVVAHRLSTVKTADKIIVLHEGKIAEEGTHNELSNIRGRYYELVKNQLELGN
ncbi:peptidase domain-containing ABC transporter [Hydrobacter penzbergensis]|uniref:peptidase domain-containing ABC transporter n=1 Tax=Hydrobacter penzbergensis TaxID=1235997 RepID=UPI00214C4CE4|nr:peptidase domain-containing ABC transporter [Hydrobacter penzbergensis]